MILTEFSCDMGSFCLMKRSCLASLVYRSENLFPITFHGVCIPSVHVCKIVVVILKQNLIYVDMYIILVMMFNDTPTNTEQVLHVFTLLQEALPQMSGKL